MKRILFILALLPTLLNAQPYTTKQGDPRQRVIQQSGMEFPNYVKLPRLDSARWYPGYYSDLFIDRDSTLNYYNQKTGTSIPIGSDAIATPEYYGAKGDGVTNDTRAFYNLLQAAKRLNYKSIILQNGSKYLLDSIYVDIDSISFIGNMASIIGHDSTITLITTLKNNVSFEGINFNLTATPSKKLAKVGYYTSQSDFTVLKGFGFKNNTVICSQGNAPLIQLHGQVLYANIEGNSFRNTRSYSSLGVAYVTSPLRSQRVIEVACGNSTATPHVPFFLNIKDNYFKNFFTSFDNFSTGYIKYLTITGNTYDSCGEGVRNYHCDLSDISNNQFYNSYAACNLWRGYVVKNNLWYNCGPNLAVDTDFLPAAVFVEGIQGDFSDNTIINALGNGLLLDGSGLAEACNVRNNSIYNSQYNGIYVSPNYRYGLGTPTQLTALSFSDNKIKVSGRHGMYFKNGIFRNILISGGIIAGPGVEAANTYAGICIEPTDSDTNSYYFLKGEIKGVTIYGRDNTYGDQSSNIAFGILLKDSLSSQGANVNIGNNIITAPIGIKSNRSTGAKTIFSNTLEYSTSPFDFPANPTAVFSNNTNATTGQTWYGYAPLTYDLPHLGITGNFPKLSLQSTLSAASSFTGATGGIDFISGTVSFPGNTNIIGLTWKSSDASLTDNNPRDLARINVRAVSSFSSNTSGGGDIIFGTAPNNAGSSPTMYDVIAATNAGNLRLFSRSANTTYIDFKVNAPTSNYTLTLPDTLGASGSVLSLKDVTGGLTWSALNNLALGETSTNAYRGDRGKIAYDHSQITDGSNPHATTYASLASKPTTLAGAGITDGLTQGGNNFGATVVVGATSNNAVQILANNAVVATFPATGGFNVSNNNYANATSSNNSLVNIGTNGLVFSRNIADANTVAKFNHINASSTGLIADFQKASVSVASVSNTGAITGSQFNISALNTAPATATSTGTTGEVRITAGFIYVCTATNTWVRAALATW